MENSKLCECGCGEQTTLAPFNDRGKGIKKDQPARFIKNHNKRKSATEYKVEDRGYKTPCWIWQRGISGGGYGNAWFNGKQISAHRMYYERANGPSHKPLDHLCRVTSCVNPDHLEPVSIAINTRRGKATKLSESDVREIRRLLTDGKSTGVAIAQKLGVSPQAICDIKHGRKWKQPTHQAICTVA